MPFLLKMSKKTKKRRRDILKLSYFSIFTNLLRTDNERKSLKTIYN